MTYAHPVRDDQHGTLTGYKNGCRYLHAEVVA